MKKTRLRLSSVILAGLLLVGCASGAGSQSAGSQTGDSEMIINTRKVSPILDQDGADPFVTTYDGGYLYTRTTGGDIQIAVSPTVQGLGAAEMKQVYDPGVDLSEVWAPEIWNLDDCWYIYFAATVPGDTMHHMFVLSNPSQNPMEGDWKLDVLAGMDDKFAIDGTIMDLDGKRYFLWSGWEGYENVRQDIYIAEMISPIEVAQEKILLSKPEIYWEKNGHPLINEGPEVLVRGKTVNLVYSASGSWTDEYCLGLLTMTLGSDPKDPASWTKDEKPILSRKDDVYGPGHNCFTTSADGSQDLIFYHGARWKGAGWNRSVRFGYVDFDENGKILPMDPVSGADEISLPESDPEITKILAKGFATEGDAAYDEGQSAMAGIYGPTDIISTEIGKDLMGEDENLTIVVWAKASDILEGSVADLEISWDGTTYTKSLCSSENYLPVFFTVPRTDGDATLTITNSYGGTELKIQCVEIRH
ncbi:MAG: glycoside hydrolase family 43 protein [Pseudobutyrivibrio sp.]|nr:glycoside hydrolase family 43 protein [Pseudobutyrivibrio sp.]